MHAFSMMSDGFFLSLSLCLDIGLVNVAMISLTLSHGFKPGFWLGSVPVSAIWFTRRSRSREWLRCCSSNRCAGSCGSAARRSCCFSHGRWRVKRCSRRRRLPLPAKRIANAPHLSPWRGFLRGALLAMSSPSAILWFAAVGGALIAKAGATSATTAPVFLGGFFLGGLVLDDLYLRTRQPWTQTRRHRFAARVPRVVSAAVRVLLV